MFKNSKAIERIESELMERVPLLVKYNNLIQKSEMPTSEEVVRYANLYMLEKEVLGLVIEYSLELKVSKKKLEKALKDKFNLRLELMTYDAVIEHILIDVEKLENNLK